MKEKSLIFYGNPCLTPLADPKVQTFEDAQRLGVKPCMYYRDRNACPPPQVGCIQLAGLKMARYVLQFYSEATEQTLALETEVFRKQAPLPPTQMKSYIDTSEFEYRQIADPELVVERVSEFAREVLDLKPGEHIMRSPEEEWEEPLPIPTTQEQPKGDKGREDTMPPAIASSR